MKEDREWFKDWTHDGLLQMHWNVTKVVEGLGVTEVYTPPPVKGTKRTEYSDNTPIVTDYTYFRETFV